MGVLKDCWHFRCLAVGCGGIKNPGYLAVTGVWIADPGGDYLRASLVLLMIAAATL